MVDDGSDMPISDWSEWAAVRTALAPATLKVHRSPTRLGVAKAKNRGVSQADPKCKVVLFLDSHSIVSVGWILPLLSTLLRFPDSLVYPAIDVIDGLAGAGGLIRADNAVGAFDWALRFRW